MLPRRSRAQAPRRRMYVAFAAAGRHWVLPAEEVAAVAELGPVTRLPTADPSRLGLTVHRGKVVAVVAVDGAGPNGGPEARQPGHLVVLRLDGTGVAVAAEELLGLKVEYGSAVPPGFELLAIDGGRVVPCSR